MVKHVIIWKLNEEHNTPEIKNGIKCGIEGLLGIVPGLVDVRVETTPLESSNADVMLYSVFEDEDALKGYAVHPEHVKVANTYVRPYTQSRSCFDYAE